MYNLLVLGSGGREHSIIWSLSQDKSISQLFCAPGNAGTQSIAKNLTVLSSNMGVVSKDSSKALVIDSLFENITEYALMSYIKKEQFEGAMLDCKKCVFNIEKDKILFKDEFSSITF